MSVKPFLPLTLLVISDLPALSGTPPATAPLGPVADRPPVHAVYRLRIRPRKRLLNNNLRTTSPRDPVPARGTVLLESARKLHNEMGRGMAQWDGNGPARWESSGAAPRSSQGASAGRVHRDAFGGRRLHRRMCQKAATPSFQPIFFPSS